MSDKPEWKAVGQIDDFLQKPESETPVERAIQILKEVGIEVARADDFPEPLPHLYRINGGPELTEKQLVYVVLESALSAVTRDAHCRRQFESILR
jgi:hypothetical protein